MSSKAGKLAGDHAFTPGYEDSFALELMKKILNNKWQPVGAVFSLVDRETGELLSHARAFEASEKSAAVLSSVLDVFSAAIKRK